MGIRFSKSIKLGDLVKVNLSKSGVSATIGKKGASINVGSKGTYLNLSPTIAGITGTGVSYRKKITGGYGNFLNTITGKKTNEKDNSIEELDDSVIQEYEKNINESINIHKLADKVLNDEGFNNKINDFNNDDVKQIYLKSKDGDEETIESLVGSFFLNFDFAYPVKANYELEDRILYIDLDLPEIEDIQKQYPTIVKDKIVNKNKTQSQIKQEYSYTIVSLSAYIAAQIFNLSSYINEIIISGFTARRNNVGDLKDEYVYSIKYLREEFIKTSLENIDNIFEFINKFENRINLNESNYSLKEIKPFEMPSVEKANNAIEEAILGLKELGYKNSIINEILPKLNSLNLNDSSEYLKEALKIINEKNN